jgi:hypothetical protein
MLAVFGARPPTIFNCGSLGPSERDAPGPNANLRNISFERPFLRMADIELIEQSFQIAWSVLERTGELREPNWSANFLLDEIIGMLRCGERRRLALSNRAIDAYRNLTVKLAS